MRITLSALAVALSLLATGCGSGPSATAGKSTASWIHQGTTYHAVQVLAKTDDFFGKPGLMVCFFDESTTCGESVFQKNRAEVFFPKSGSSYAAPISVAFRTASGQGTQENSPAGYTGEIASVDSEAKSVKGRVKIQGVGLNDDASIEAEFNAELCP